MRFETGALGPVVTGWQASPVPPPDPMVGRCVDPAPLTLADGAALWPAAEASGGDI